MHDRRRGGPPPSERCLRAAVTESVAWGAQLLVAKGDLAEHGSYVEAARAAALLAEGGVPVTAVVGNHEVRSGAEPAEAAFAELGVPLVSHGVGVRDLPGFRLVLFDSTVPTRHAGSYAHHADDVVDAVAEAGSPVVLLTHHQPQPLRVPHHWPPGVPSHEARRFFDRVARANARTFVSTGHTHRHRRHEYGPIVVTEVGSPQHYPGTWAGYVVHEGGIRQVVRRVAAPDAIEWTEATARSVLGTWKRWSPGRISDRSFSHTW